MVMAIIAAMIKPMKPKPDDTVIYVHLGQNIVDQTDFQRLDHCQRNEETDDSHQNRQRRNFNFPYLETKEKLFAALQHNIG